MYGATMKIIIYVHVRNYKTRCDKILLCSEFVPGAATLQVSQMWIYLSFR